MKQLIQNLKTGQTLLEDVPVPIVKEGHLLIKTSKSLVSLGTERMLVEFAKANYLQKAKQQPDKVKMVIDKIKTDGLQPTLQSVFNKLNQPLPLGYSNVGTVVAIGKGVSGYKIGDRVVSNGPHAEYVMAPKNLTAHIPDEVTDEEASFTVVGSIGLQGIRLANPTMGETFVVIGLGLIGLLTAEMLIANGCNVIGYDLDDQKVKIAQEKGITAFNPGKGTDPVQFVMQHTQQIGADGVIITASAKTHDIIAQAAQMSRKKGRIILVGVVGLNLSRADFYEKELTFQVSCSYGPGRYDENYELKGHDYPIGYVRWTEQRNFEAVLNLIKNKKLNVKPLISRIIDFENYSEIYSNMKGDKTIANILTYKNKEKPSSKISLFTKSFKQQKGVIGIIGAGNFTSVTMLPILQKLNANLKTIASSGGLSATGLAKKYKIPNVTTDYQEILYDQEIDTVIITTRHNLHAPMVIEALQHGKNVFVEKPLAIDKNELEEIIKTYSQSKGSLTVGFNRRFAPFSKKIKDLLGSSNQPINIIATMNAGYIPPESWVHDMEIGGGRIIGEACHFIDLITYLTGSKVEGVIMNALGKQPEENTDNASIILKYENGSNAVINYFSNGSKKYSKERLEVYAQNRTIIMDNWRKLYTYGFRGKSKYSNKQDKGHYNQFKELLNFISTGDKTIIPFDEIINTTKASFSTIESLKTSRWISVK